MGGQDTAQEEPGFGRSPKAGKRGLPARGQSGASRALSSARGGGGSAFLFHSGRLTGRSPHTYFTRSTDLNINLSPKTPLVETARTLSGQVLGTPWPGHVNAQTNRHTNCEWSLQDASLCGVFTGQCPQGSSTWWQVSYFLPFKAWIILSSLLYYCYCCITLSSLLLLLCYCYRYCYVIVIGVLLLLYYCYCYCCLDGPRLA